MTERKAEVTVEELQADGCLSGDCPHGSASDCLDHLTLMIAALCAPASEGEAVRCVHVDGPCECGPEGFGLRDDDPRVNATHPAPATVTEAMCKAAMREHAAQMGEPFDSLWNTTDASTRATLLDEWKHILTAALGGAR